MSNGPALQAVPSGAAPDSFPAKCPECAFRGGPFQSPRLAQDALIRHIEDKHQAFLAFVRQRPLLSGNEGFARANVTSLINQVSRLDKAINSPIASGPIDVPTEMIAFIRGASKAMASILDLLLEMRTGRSELVPVKKDEGAA